MRFKTISYTLRHLQSPEQTRRLMNGQDVRENPAVMNVTIPPGVILDTVTEGGTAQVAFMTGTDNESQRFVDQYPDHSVLVPRSFRSTWLEELE